MHARDKYYSSLIRAKAAARYSEQDAVEVIHVDAPSPGEFPHVFNLLARKPPTGDEPMASVAQIECTWVTTADKPWPWQLLKELRIIW